MGRAAPHHRQGRGVIHLDRLGRQAAGLSVRAGVLTALGGDFAPAEVHPQICLGVGDVALPGGARKPIAAMSGTPELVVLAFTLRAVPGLARQGITTFASTFRHKRKGLLGGGSWPGAAAAPKGCRISPEANRHGGIQRTGRCGSWAICVQSVPFRAGSGTTLSRGTSALIAPSEEITVTAWRGRK